MATFEYPATCYLPQAPFNFVVQAVLDSIRDLEASHVAYRSSPCESQLVDHSTIQALIMELGNSLKGTVPSNMFIGKD